MTSVCLSNTVNLRCTGFSRRNAILLIIPTFWELVFSVALAVHPKEASSDWFLVVESWSYLVLSILDVVSHTVPQVQNSVTGYKVFDILVGSASSVPLLAMGLFLTLLLSSTVTVTFRPRLRSAWNYGLVTFLPSIVMFDEISSFFGTKYVIASNQAETQILAVEFFNSNFFSIWTFFESFSLAVFTVFQALCFTLVMYQLIGVQYAAYRAESMGRNDEIYLSRGLGWMAVGLKLGAVETVIGFLPPSFGRSLARRILRLVSRALLMIGTIKGTNVVEDVSFFEDIEPARERGARRISRLLFGRTRRNHVEHEKSLKRPRPRVTVDYTGKTPPVLQMRFSELDMPDAHSLLRQMRYSPSNSTASLIGSHSDEAGGVGMFGLKAIPFPLIGHKRGVSSTQGIRSNSTPQEGESMSVSVRFPFPSRTMSSNSSTRASPGHPYGRGFGSLANHDLSTPLQSHPPMNGRSNSGKRKPVPRMLSIYDDMAGTGFPFPIREMDSPTLSRSPASSIILFRPVISSNRNSQVASLLMESDIGVVHGSMIHSSPLKGPSGLADDNDESSPFHDGDALPKSAFRDEFTNIENEIRRTKSQHSQHSMLTPEQAERMPKRVRGKGKASSRSSDEGVDEVGRKRQAAMGRRI